VVVDIKQHKLQFKGLSCCTCFSHRVTAFWQLFSVVS